MLIIVSIVLYLVPVELIPQYLGHENKLLGISFGSVIGSVVILPGFISFPLCGILLKKNVLYMVLSVFTTALMMVGVLIYPVEKEYFRAGTAKFGNIF